MSHTIGFIGVGAMGYHMAALLTHAGYTMTVLDAAAEAVSRFIQSHPNAKTAESVQELAHCDVVITMLPSSKAVEQVVLGKEKIVGLIDVMQKGATLIDMSSSAPASTRELAASLHKKGIQMLDAPVSGGVRRAIDGSLAVMVGGDEKILKQMEPVLACLGKTITHVGSHGAGHAVKALNNYVSAAGLVAAAEATLAGQAFGLDPNVMADVFNGSTGRNNTTEHKLKQFMLSGTFAAGFSLRLMEKDVATALELGVGQGQEMALCKRLTQMWHDAADALPPTADHTAIYGFLEQTQTKH